jgi:hypothetical protein
MNNNGHPDKGPPFAVIGTGFSILPRDGVLEMLEKNILLQGKENLVLAPLFRKTKEDFREFAKIAEPGSLFRAPEINLFIIRLSMFAPIATSLSDAARKQAEAAQEPIPNDRLKIALE